MKELRGSATADVTASPEECLALLQDIERYPSWYPDVVRRVEIVRPAEAGAPIRARTTVHLGIGPIRRDFNLLMEVRSETGRIIRLARVKDETSDAEELSATWRIDDGSPAGRTRLTVEVSARLEVPRLLPLHGLGDAVARDFAAAAAQALSRR
jgi:ribosome-associated toxin RatA of RatAB toxin-antitoxin module